MSVDNKSIIYNNLAQNPALENGKTAKKQAILLVAHISVNVHANQLDFTSDAKKTHKR